MKSLGINWFIEGSIDFEHKKYILLDYLQEINRHFDRSKLYPNLADLVFHYNNLLDFKRNKTVLQQAFPQQMTKADIEAVKLTYQKIIQDDTSMQEIESIISFALHKMDPAIQTGREIYDFVESQLNIDPVGVMPLMPYHGYFSLRNGGAVQTLRDLRHPSTFLLQLPSIHPLGPRRHETAATMQPRPRRQRCLLRLGT